MSSAGAGGSSGGADGGRTIPPEIQEQINIFQKLQGEIQEAIRNQSQLESQRHENTMVKEAFAEMEDEDPVFKRVGPVMVRQDVAEARVDVDSRIAFIDGELAKTEIQIKEKTTQQTAVREKIQQMQKKMQEEGSSSA